MARASAWTLDPPWHPCRRRSFHARHGCTVLRSRLYGSRLQFTLRSCMHSWRSCRRISHLMCGNARKISSAVPIRRKYDGLTCWSAWVFVHRICRSCRTEHGAHWDARTRVSRGASHSGRLEKFVVRRKRKASSRAVSSSNFCRASHQTVTFNSAHTRKCKSMKSSQRIAKRLSLIGSKTSVALTFCVAVACASGELPPRSANDPANAKAEESNHGQPPALARAVGREADESRKSPNTDAGAASYVCPMHSDVVRPVPGTCPKCGMTLRPVSAP